MREMRETKSFSAASEGGYNSYGGLSIGVTASPPSVIINEVERARRARRRKPFCPTSSTLPLYTCLMCLSTAGERIFFKVAIDQMEPFRVFLAILVNLFLVVVSGALVWWKKSVSSFEITPHMHRFPRKSIVLIALLDTLSLVVMVVAGASTPPVLSVLFMQATIPFLMLLSSFLSRHTHTHTHTHFTEEHWQGAFLILLGIAVAMAPTVHAAFWQGQHDIGINTLAYVLCCLPAALSQLVKESAIVTFGQPMNGYLLNFRLSIYQAVLLLILSPLTYRLQGLGQGWDAYAKNDLGTAVSDLCLCLFTSTKIDPKKYPVAPECHRASLATASYVLCTLLVTFAVNGVLEHGTPFLLYRTINVSVCLSFLILALYSMDKWALFSSYALNIFDFIGLLLVVWGLERYHRQPEPDTEMLTHFTPDIEYT